MLNAGISPSKKEYCTPITAIHGTCVRDKTSLWLDHVGAFDDNLSAQQKACFQNKSNRKAERVREKEKGKGIDKGREFENNLSKGS